MNIFVLAILLFNLYIYACIQMKLNITEKYSETLFYTEKLFQFH